MTQTLWQPSLLDSDPPAFDPEFRGTRRQNLGSGAWLEHTPQWLRGAAALFELVLDQAPWAAHERLMYERVVPEPRLTTGKWANPPPLVTSMAQALSRRFDHDMGVVSANFYRDGRDSVAWHGDRVGRQRTATVVAIVSLGTARRFLLRPAAGGTSLRLLPRPGDLLVLGGTIQKTWQHSVPKSTRAGPRISVMFREEY